MKLVISDSKKIPSQLDVKDTNLVENLQILYECTHTNIDEYTDVYIDIQYFTEEEYNSLIKEIPNNITIHCYIEAEEFEVKTLEAYKYKDIINQNTTNYKNIVVDYGDSIPKHLDENETILLEVEFDELLTYINDNVTDIYVDNHDWDEGEYNKLIEISKSHNINFHYCYRIQDYIPEPVEIYTVKKYPTRDYKLSIRLDKSYNTYPTGIITLYGNTENVHILFDNINKQLILRDYDTCVIEPPYNKDTLNDIVNKINKIYDEMISRFDNYEKNGFDTYMTTTLNYKALFIYNLDNLLSNLSKLNNTTYTTIKEMIKNIANLGHSANIKLIVTINDTTDEVKNLQLYNSRLTILTKNSHIDLKDFLDLYFKDLYIPNHDIDARMTEDYDARVKEFHNTINSIQDNVGIYLYKEFHDNMLNEKDGFSLIDDYIFNIDQIKDLD